MKILVTGGTGVIGMAAIPSLVGAGHHVRLLSRHAARDARSLPAGVEAFEADITQPEQLAGVADDYDCVLHIAGIVEEQPPKTTFERINVEGTRHLLEAAASAGEPKFIYVSSLGADRGESDYHASKRRAEEAVRNYAGRWLILRPGNVYGPGDETISMLLKMVRTLPAVPMIEDGVQPFQPLWYADLGRVLVQAVENETLAGQTLELAGPDVTTTDDVLERLAAITGRNPPRLAVPAWLTKLGAVGMEAFGAAGKKFLQRGGLGTPINSDKLSMLLEGNVIPDGRPNALLTVFGVTPTALADGLAMLADSMPEQLPGEGVGALKHARYWADIEGTRYSATELLEHVRTHITDVMPIEFAAEPGSPTEAEEGVTMTAEIKGRGNVQVRLEERTPNCLTFVTLEGHPLAGVMQLQAEDISHGVRFGVDTLSQPSNVLDWLAMHPLGETMQKANWRSVVRRVVALSGGEAPGGVRQKRHEPGSEETRDLEKWIERLVQRQQRTRSEEAAGAAGREEAR